MNALAMWKHSERMAMQSATVPQLAAMERKLRAEVEFLSKFVAGMAALGVSTPLTSANLALVKNVLAVVESALRVAAERSINNRHVARMAGERKLAKRAASAARPVAPLRDWYEPARPAQGSWN
jgi:hypothetical protein